ncbi:MAG: penicillin-binding protein activator [Myxococcaceae bacterium]
MCRSAAARLLGRLGPVCLLVLGCATTHVPENPNVPPMGRKPEVEPRPDTRAADALKAADAAAVGQPKSKQLEVYLSVRQAYPTTVAGEEALYRAACLAYELGEYAVARKQLNELLFENPLFDKALDARLKLGESSLQLKAYRDAYQTLVPLREKVPPEQRAELEDALRRAAEGARMANQSFRLALDRAESAATPEERQAALQQVASLLDTSVPYDEVARVQEELSPSHPAWPMLTFKLARVYAHRRDARLKPTLEALLQKAPSSPYSQQAQAMLVRLDRVGAVRGRTLGVLVPLTGKYQRLGEAVMRGIKLALKGSDIELLVKDTQGDPARAAAAVEELVFEDGAVAAIGPLFGEDSRRAAVVAQDLGLPLLTLTRNEDITEIGPFVFRNMLTYSAEGRALASWAVDVMGYKSFAVLYPNTSYGVEMTSDFWDQVTAKGAAVRGAEAYANDQTTFTTEAKKLVGRYYLEDRTDYLEALRELKEANRENNADAFRRRKALEKAKKDLEPIVDFEALFIPDEWSRVGLIAPALAVEDIITNTCDAKEIEKLKKTTGKTDIHTVTLLGGQGWNSPKNAEGVPRLIERGGKFVLCSVFVDGFYAESNREATRRFVHAYSEAYPDATPLLLDAVAYDSARILRQVLEAQKPPLTRDGVRAALAAVKDFDGATGRTTFNERREAEKPLFFLTVDSKGVRELQPQERLRGS